MLMIIGLDDDTYIFLMWNSPCTLASLALRKYVRLHSQREVTVMVGMAG